MAPCIAVVTGRPAAWGAPLLRGFSAERLSACGGRYRRGCAGRRDALTRPAFEAEPCDLTDAGAISALFARIVARHGGIDALVNNAGTCLMSDFPDIPADEPDRQMAINFSLGLHRCQGAVKAMLGRPGVRKIVNISSNGAYNFDVFDPPHYRASKAAMDTLTKDLARRYARDRIAVNSIAPAMTETPLFNVLSEEVLARAIAAMPHGAAMRLNRWRGWSAS